MEEEQLFQSVFIRQKLALLAKTFIKTQIILQLFEYVVCFDGIDPSQEP